MTEAETDAVLEAQETQFFDDAARNVLAILPERKQDMARLQRIKNTDTLPTVTVIGKYNHGKSRLLNELTGTDRFSVADRRETVELSEFDTQGVRWLDAPGLDADIEQKDDGHAHQATWVQADIRLFVHAAKEGELDARERTLLETLRRDDERTLRQTLFVLTQVDQLSDTAVLDQVSRAIAAQASAMPIHAVSATRHRQGVAGDKKLLVEKSGIPALQSLLSQALAKVPQARAHEAATLFSSIGEELDLLLKARKKELVESLAQQHQQRSDFEQGLTTVFDKIAVDLQPVLEVSGTDQSLVPDSFENMFKLTAGKRERAHIQIAYSRACIAINAHLVKHGVTELPQAQQTSVRSLDTVMVAVMGVSVKYRDDLRRMFCEPDGRVHLQQQFARYFELSEDRMNLSHRITDTQAHVEQLERAIASLQVLEQA
ncbi:hypothetical protein G7048_27650 (plasmid) [Diaphorobacter sp. HDW4B]|uniref:GTPase n=1 Tax=Diaphorobacter sp. HDW4B TaxID=2714925 RepID=UPI00140CD981|nr:GTPase [Diaphorobacter sp. HDW4B]QIL74246.1 hypothetical protein G7048_27650 [Diaphorobacter sp. HDW4B]